MPARANRALRRPDYKRNGHRAGRRAHPKYNQPMSSSDRDSGLPPATAQPLRQRLQQATDLLEAAAVAEARPSAERLLLHALGRERSFLYAHPEYRLTPSEEQQFAQLLQE